MKNPADETLAAAISKTVDRPPGKKHFVSERELHSLRKDHYNAEVAAIDRIHDDLMIIRVRPDHSDVQFTPGQYTVLGLGYWEKRVAGTQDEELDERQIRAVVKRAYSVSCPLIGDDGQLVRVGSSPVLEFYVTLVRFAVANPPALTPRLFALTVGDRLLMSSHYHGHHTLRQFSPETDVVFVATGTGEAPHNAMLPELLAAGHRGRLVSVNCVRYERDLAYLHKHRELERRYPNYQYLTLTTREPRNLDPTTADYVGKRYLQEYFSSGEFQSDTGLELVPQRTHVYLCGGPAMIGVPHHTHDPSLRYPTPMGMIEVLEKRGFTVDKPHEPGNIHFEKYW